jgi:hypothetical protein
MEKPLIQIDDEVREMTDEEYAEYLVDIEANKKTYPDVVAS